MGDLNSLIWQTHVECFSELCGAEGCVDVGVDPVRAVLGLTWPHTSLEVLVLWVEGGCLGCFDTTASPI